MYDTICTFPLPHPSPLFTLALHPRLPQLSIGLASGHVQTFHLPLPSPSPQDTPSDAQISTLWRTKRHPLSCRSLTYSHDGESLYSAGSEGIVKCARADDGRVRAKYALPATEAGEVDAPTVVQTLTPDVLLIGTDAGRIHLRDLREKGDEEGKAKVWVPHGGEFVSSITPLLPQDGTARQFLSTGGATLALTDIRKGVVRTSEEQGEELTCSLLVQGVTVLVGQGDGVVTGWDRPGGRWDDHDERVVVSREGNSVECMAEVPGSAVEGKMVAVGMEDGRVRFLRLGGAEKRVVPEWDGRHDDGVDGVVAVGFDVAGRMVTGGGGAVKVWHRHERGEGGRNGAGQGKHEVDDGEDSDDEEEAEGEEREDEEDSEESEQRGKRKKRKRNRGKDKSGEQQIGKIEGLG